MLNNEIQEFINTHLNSDMSSLLLKGITFPNVDTKEIIQQIEAKKKCDKKLPTWFNTPNIYYPNKFNIEQTSSEVTAEYKSNLISGKSLIDLTGGFGVDSYYFSKRFNEVIQCEINESLTGIVAHNYKILGNPSIKTSNCDGIQFLEENDSSYDWIYLDPSRRHDSKGKVFFLKDCLPNVPEVINLLFEHSKNVMIKTSPLLDISVGISELKFVREIHVVAVENEVKELLWILENHYEREIKNSTINLKNSKNETFSFMMFDEGEAKAQYSEPLDYLYEPNSAILKAGAFKSVSAQTGVFKLHPNSHLYTLEVLIKFPGRRFKIDKILPYSKSVLKLELPKKANITIRNFTESVAEIRKKYKIAEGGNTYLFFTTNINNEKIVLICSKVG